MSKNKGREPVPTKSIPAEKSAAPPDRAESSSKSAKKAHPAKHPHGRN